MKVEFIKATYNQVWKTRGARFVSHSNYLIQSKSSTFTIATLSVYVIVLSLIFISPTLNEKINSGDLSLITLAASLLTLIFSQIESSKDYKLKAEKLHRNAMELSDIYHEIQALYFSEEDLDKRYLKAKRLSKTYNSIVQKCDENHNSYDYKLFLANNWSKEGIDIPEWKSKWTRFYIGLRLRFYFSLWILTPFILYFLL